MWNSRLNSMHEQQSPIGIVYRGLSGIAEVHAMHSLTGYPSCGTLHSIRRAGTGDLVHMRQLRLRQLQLMLLCCVVPYCDSSTSAEFAYRAVYQLTRTEFLIAWSNQCYDIGAGLPGCMPTRHTARCHLRQPHTEVPTTCSPYVFPRSRHEGFPL